MSSQGTAGTVQAKVPAGPDVAGGAVSNQRKEAFHDRTLGCTQ